MEHFKREAKLVNGVFRAFGMRVKVKKVIVGSMILVNYHLKYSADQSISDIEKRLPELEERLSAFRKNKTVIRFATKPIRLEVEHPNKQPLFLTPQRLIGTPGKFLLGRTFDYKPDDLWIEIGKMPHCLVAGGSGSGKSITLVNMVLSACFNTSPGDLRLFLFDMKNTDFLPLERLKHVEKLVTTNKDAEDLLRELNSIRIERESKTVENNQRIVIVVDEFTDLIDSKEAMSSVENIARKGRSSNINLILATQHPTSKAIGGTMIKNNILTRCVGEVADSNASSIATGRPGLHAERLPGQGSFLSVKGNDVTRFQSYLFDEIMLESLITRINRKWTEVVIIPVLTSYLSKKPVSTTSIEEKPDNQLEMVKLPIGYYRELTSLERKEVKRLSELNEFQWSGKPSINKLVMRVYGSKCPKRITQVKEAIENEKSKNQISN